ncbi:Mut7-C RNAse domain-containing protein [Desulfoluna spongiiphila]|uniref:Twitching motility protein PilT n=1 Tax=Desulfoluna spongiiphila TaxID=419481 RepID=A0A1G5J051_9BACT|nr:Mut7-C RNAse domain-containing protein [Desulfoluna spongiiphila]SCY81733.1 hypothetical protein SAMN05216233_12363 [Desulfoluna spongiiphila]
MMPPFEIHLVVHGEIGWFFARKNRKADLCLVRDRRASIKDILESLGLPHTEVGRLLADGMEVGFNHVPVHDCRVDVHPVNSPFDVTRPTVLRPEAWDKIRFLVDDNVGRLAGLLRAVGVDALHTRGTTDFDLAARCEAEHLILLTRDLGLLKRKQILFGRYIRESDPYRQLKEVLSVFGINGPYAFFSRCFLCNCPLKPIEKETVSHRLKPETCRYVSAFSSCPSCQRLYWHGPHVRRMLRKMADAGIDVSGANTHLLD